jgi:hypothetical protein
MSDFIPADAGRRMADGTVLVSKSVAQIVTFWKVGSYDWTWAEEYADVMAQDKTAEIYKRVDSEGITFLDHVAPVMLGSDGRVWDGHHRICIAIQRGIHSLMCEIATPASEAKS